MSSNNDNDIVRRLRRAGKRHGVTVRAAQQATGTLHALIREASVAGMSYRQIAAAAGVSHQRVAQIVRDEP